MPGGSEQIGNRQDGRSREQIKMERRARAAEAKAKKGQFFPFCISFILIKIKTFTKNVDLCIVPNVLKYTVHHASKSSVNDFLFQLLP